MAALQDALPESIVQYVILPFTQPMRLIVGLVVHKQHDTVRECLDSIVGLADFIYILHRLSSPQTEQVIYEWSQDNQNQNIVQFRWNRGEKQELIGRLFDCACICMEEHNWCPQNTYFILVEPDEQLVCPDIDLFKSELSQSMELVANSQLRMTRYASTRICRLSVDREIVEQKLGRADPFYSIHGRALNSLWIL